MVSETSYLKFELKFRISTCYYKLLGLVFVTNQKRVFVRRTESINSCPLTDK